VRELLAEVEGGGEWDPRRHAEKMGRLAQFMGEGAGESGGDDERHPFEGEEVISPARTLAPPPLLSSQPPPAQSNLQNCLDWMPGRACVDPQSSSPPF
jgi:hypothetical protein